MFLQPITAAYTLTFGDHAENVTGMQIIGESAPKGISVQDLQVLQQILQLLHIETEMIYLTFEGPPIGLYF